MSKSFFHNHAMEKLFHHALKTRLSLTPIFQGSKIAATKGRLPHPKYLRHLIKKDATLKPFRHLSSVNTVDGFQGQERDIIIVSLVRSNSEGQIGFLSDLRRMNVAMTRARSKLNIIGGSHTLSRHSFYRRLYEYVRQVGSDGEA